MLRSFPLLAALIVLLPGIVMAQPFGIVQGEILGADGKPVQGATVKIVGTLRGAVSKADGSFTVLRVPAGDYDVTISSIAYHNATLRVRVVGDTMITVKVELAEWPFVGRTIHTRRCPPIPPERYGTIRRITFDDLDRSPRATLFGGAF